jgi:DNA topoisomerase-1
LGNHPKDGKPVTIKDGRYGPYVHHGRLMATMPKGTEKDDVTLALAVTRLAEKATRGGKGAKATKPAKKKSAKAKAKPAAAKI